MISTNGNHAGAVITFAEVTALIRALSAKDNFVATVSHELRTPLTSIIGYLELVLDEPGHEDTEEELRIVHRNANHLLGLVNDLIAVASERIELTLHEADVASLLTSVVDSSHAKAAINGVELVLDVEKPLTARVDPERIRQVFGHLVSNAIKFSPDGGTGHGAGPPGEQPRGLFHCGRRHRYGRARTGTGRHQVLPVRPLA
ncbi:sensor histidine kinase [Arthrobacter sp. ISL-65]|uniref:sensor histidine kinase n=1 Tax=Arthrobacter sp. ISL-65 TaxID=2819112 RepID=UPI0020357DD8|nr:sensor histidine kinase [Arthrobacter sp. ISL-65]